MTDPITRLNAALAGCYRIERQLGEGGMATGLHAEDIKHGRKVALKVLKPELAAVGGLRVGQRPEEHTVGDAEDGGRGSDAERQGEVDQPAGCQQEPA